MTDTERPVSGWCWVHDHNDCRSHTCECQCHDDEPRRRAALAGEGAACDHRDCPPRPHVALDCPSDDPHMACRHTDPSGEGAADQPHDTTHAG